MNTMEAHSPMLDEPSINILGSRVHLIPTDRTVDHIERWIRMRDDQCHQIVVTGFHGLMEAYKSPDLSAILNKADLWVPDGIAPVWLAKLRGHCNVVRTPGAEIVSEFLRRADQTGFSSYFYGDTEQTLATLCNIVSREYPGHRIAGSYSPPFRTHSPQEEDEVIERINLAQPDVLWVALGMPKQDIWIHQRISRLKVPVAIGVGAAFAFVAGTVPRCPAWMGNAGFEWVYRFLKEPRKLWRRDILDGPRFIFHAAMELLRREPANVTESTLAD
jgi:N-acetylglucosaminyldiphosphoundecaprenol N-acetyl-beta-D-mannosaminyltransferase